MLSPDARGGRRTLRCQADVTTALDSKARLFDTAKDRASANNA